MPGDPWTIKRYKEWEKNFLGETGMANSEAGQARQIPSGYLDKHCALCWSMPVRYVKTRGGFYKVCDSCRKVLETALLTIESDQIYPQEDISSETPMTEPSKATTNPGGRIAEPDGSSHSPGKTERS